MGFYQNAWSLIVHKLEQETEAGPLQVACRLYLKPEQTKGGLIFSAADKGEVWLRFEAHAGERDEWTLQIASPRQPDNYVLTIRSDQDRETLPFHPAGLSHLDALAAVLYKGLKPSEVFRHRFEALRARHEQRDCGFSTIVS